MINNCERLLKDIPELTAEHEQQVEQYFPQYAFYENKSKKSCDYFCTSCHCWHLNEPFRLAHNQFHICNHCGEAVKAKALHYGRKNLETSRKIGFCFAVGDRLYIRFVTAYQQFCSCDLYNENPTQILPQYFFTNEYLYIYEQHAMQRFAYSWYDKSFYPLKTDGIIPYRDYSWRAREWESTVLINLDVISQTKLKYSAAMDIAEKYTPAHAVLKWLLLYVKHNNIEYLVKGGFDNIAELLLKGNLKLNKIRWRENNLLKMLGCKKADINYFIDYDNAEVIALYHDIVKENPKLQTVGEIVTVLSALGVTAVNDLRSYGLTFKQILKYGKNRRRVQLWKDYLDNCKRLPEGVEELMPVHLEQAHDRTLEKIAYYTSKQKSEMIKKRAKALKPLLMSTENLVMLVPENGEEIIAEGRLLKHCVGGYVNRHASGSTIILFIRHKDEPTIPYFTIEVDPKALEIIQCHGYRNEFESGGVKPCEILVFEQQYAKFLKEIRNARNNKQSA